MRLWVTRTQPEAAATAGRLRQRGHYPVVVPLLEQRPLSGVVLDMTAATAIAFTSRHAVKAYAALSDRRDLPVFAVGDATAGAARDAGFLQVASASGDLAALAELIAHRLTPGDHVIWPRTVQPAGDLAALLKDAGITVAAPPIYETLETDAPTPTNIDGIIIHSPKAATALGRRLNSLAMHEFDLFCISSNAARPLQDYLFRRVVVAPRPDETALLEAIAG